MAKKIPDELTLGQNQLGQKPSDFMTYHDRYSSLVLSIRQIEIFLQASKTGTRDVGAVEDVKNKDTE